MKKARYPLAWCAVMAVAAAGCSSATSTPPSAGNGGTFSVAAFEPPSFIPGQNNGAANEELDTIYAPLTEFNPQNKLTDVQAQSVTASDGGLLWTITIKPGWTFQNGEPVTAQSYINAWNATAYGPNAWVELCQRRVRRAPDVRPPDPALAGPIPGYLVPAAVS